MMDKMAAVTVIIAGFVMSYGESRSLEPFWGSISNIELIPVIIVDNTIDQAQLFYEDELKDLAKIQPPLGNEHFTYSNEDNSLNIPKEEYLYDEELTRGKKRSSVKKDLSKLTKNFPGPLQSLLWFEPARGRRNWMVMNRGSPPKLQQYVSPGSPMLIV